MNTLEPSMSDFLEPYESIGAAIAFAEAELLSLGKDSTADELKAALIQVSGQRTAALKALASPSPVALTSPEPASVTGEWTIHAVSGPVTMIQPDGKRRTITQGGTFTIPAQPTKPDPASVEVVEFVKALKDYHNASLIEQALKLGELRNAIVQIIQPGEMGADLETLRKANRIVDLIATTVDAALAALQAKPSGGEG
jgi:hypothetical protein